MNEPTIDQADTVQDSSGTQNGLPSETHAALCLKLVPGVGPRIYGDLIDRFGSAASALAASPADLRGISGVGGKLVSAIVNAPNTVNVDQQISVCQANNIQIIDRDSETYPAPLSEIYDPPSVLFCRGTLIPADNLAIAIVGSRHATNYGIKTASRLARGLAMSGITVVSGLARGIDAAAHHGAIEAGGRTLAVLGGGHLRLYPAEHAKLAKQITEQGAVLSESLPESAPKNGSFPRRNRIVSGLSLGVVVVEAAQRSGALISARLAMEQGRDVFAIPGRIDNRMARGCHQLLKDGAKLVESVDDILEELGPLSAPTRIDSETEIRHPAELKLSEQESLVLNAINTEPTEFDLIMEQTCLPASRVLSTISVLEMRRLIKRVSGTALVRV